ncbi:MAG: tetraacyldisaccharide 4'-kinase [Gammaproteobacteria bacterium]|nr:tetraacyldisaccharide 4'-kinase [Gammaproteobacteria bacterium]
MTIEHFLNQLWYQPKKRLAWGLFPFACCYALGAWIRRFYLTQFCQWTAPVPVVVVGNITLGGVGKTPLVMAIAQHCLQQGLRVGIVSRGYGARLRQFPHQVLPHEAPSQVGDEPLLMAKHLGCPVVIAPRRVEAVQYLLKHHSVDLIVSDDGLQHYALGRAVDIAVIDGVRGMGNGLRCPAGPLRESVKRLQDVDFCVVNEGHWKHAFQMKLEPVAFRALKTGQLIPLASFNHQTVAAVAGIGSPQRFFATLKRCGLLLTPHIFPDHHVYVEQDFESIVGPVVMTEKDAIKCQAFAKDDWYSLCVEARLDATFWQQFDRALMRHDTSRNPV